MFDNITILYVEDEDQIRSVVKSVSTKLFKQFLTAKNGQEALDIFKKNKDTIDLIVTDINMPKLNGIDMAYAIREINPDIPIIITTAHNEKDFLHEAIKIGVSAFVLKPMDMKILLNTIQKTIQPILLKKQLVLEQQQHLEERVQSAKFAATGKLAAGITHEINTPLTYIKANFEMLGYDIEDLGDSKEKKNIVKSMEKISDGIRRIENIVGSMKEMAQYSTGKKEDANIYSSVVTAAILAYNKIKHTANVYINGELFNLDMDKNKYSYIANVQLQRVEQVWIIIINNAMDELVKIEQFKDRILRIDISEKNNEVIVRFKDNAGGISDEIMEHLFDPFKGTKESSGMGIGLSIAKKIIDDQYKSTINAYNEDNGAVFEIILKNNPKI